MCCVCVSVCIHACMRVCMVCMCVSVRMHGVYMSVYSTYRYILYVYMY